MSFLNPLFLFGLVALAVPLLIHIINLRKPQSLSFSTLAFFTELQKSTIRRIKIKRYLLLLLRIAAIVLLALALARPFLPTEMVGSTSGNNPRAVAILIDNSPSMDQIDQKGPYLDQAKAAASRYVRQARENDRFMVQQTNGESLSSRWVSASSAEQQIQNIEVLEKGNYLGKRLQSLQEQVKQSPLQQAAIYVFTDAQRSQWEEVKKSAFMNTDSEGKYVGLQIVKVGSETQKNVAITDISLQSQMLSKEKPVTLQIGVRNHGDEPIANQFISLQVDTEMVGQYQTDIPANGTKEFLFEFVPDKVGQVRGKAVLEGDPVPFDNQRYFVLNIPTSRSVLLVNESDQDKQYKSYLSTTLKAAEETGSQLTFDQVRLDQLTEDDWLDKDVLIFDGVRKIPEYLFSDIQRFVQQGKGVVFFPSEKGDIPGYNNFFKQFNAGKFRGIRGEYGRFESVARLQKIKEGHPIINELFDKQEREEIQVERPNLFYYYQYEKGSGSESLNVLNTSIQDPLLVEQAFGEGRLLISTIGTDPGWSNFPVNPLFAPVFYRTALYAASSDKGGLNTHTLGEPFVWTGALPEPIVTLEKDQQTVKPEVGQVAEGYKVTFEGKAWSPGWVKLNSGTFEDLIALNIDKGESNFETFKEDELGEVLGDQVQVDGFLNLQAGQDWNQAIESAGMGKEIWHWFIWAALLLLMAETFLSRWYKAETIS